MAGYAQAGELKAYLKAALKQEQIMLKRDRDRDRVRMLPAADELPGVLRAAEDDFVED